jgi:hypothetical protein
MASGKAVLRIKFPDAKAIIAKLRQLLIELKMKGR